ncbi:MAG: permease [Thermoguttaceae bacterium]
MDYTPMLLDTLGMFAFLGAELSILFIAICFLVSLLQCYISETRIQAFLGGRYGTGYFFAALLGAITPFCSCSTIPMLRGLLKAKAGFGPVMVFLFTSPLLNPVIIGLFAFTFGIRTTLIYTAIALGVSLVAGFLLGLWRFERYIIPEKSAVDSGSAASTCCNTSAKPAAASCCGTAAKPVIAAASACGCTPAATVAPPQNADTGCGCNSANTAPTSCCDAKPSNEKRTFRQNLRFSARDAWRQFCDVLPYLVLGIGLGSVVYGFVPSELIATYASGDNPWAVPIAAVIGIPLYVRMEALIPLSAVFAQKGMGLGAIMALLIGGSGASITELILLKSMFRTQMMVAFLAVILGMAIFAGYLFQYVI